MTDQPKSKVHPATVLWRRLTQPLVLVIIAVTAGWTGAFQLINGQPSGWALLVLTTLMAFLAAYRGRELAQVRSSTLRSALATADRRNEELETLRHLSASLLKGLDLAALCEEVARGTMDLLHAETGIVTIVVEEGRFVKLAAAAGPMAQMVGTLVPMDQSLVGWAVTNDEPVLSADMEADPRNHEMSGSPLRLHSCAIVPLRSGGLIIGTVSAYNRLDGRSFDASDVTLLETLGDQVALGLDRSSVMQDLQQNEQELVAKNVELQRATQLKSEFLANMSHELRTPLNAIIGFSDLMLTEEAGPLNDVQRDFLHSVLRNGRHLLTLISSVLDLSKIEAGHMDLHLQPTDIREAVSGAVADTASLRAAKSQQSEIQMDDRPLVVVADGGRLRQVLFNLLSNASKFTPEGGHITLSVVRTQAPLPVPHDVHGDVDDGRHHLLRREAVWISVADDGIGIPVDDIPRLFTEFSQVDSSASRREQGTGLGLALSKQLVDLHAGTIGVESIHGKGSSFWFLLPVDGPMRTD
ncbi:MAG: ATP-binding protein [Gemmatimonadales bacterium]